MSDRRKAKKRKDEYGSDGEDTEKASKEEYAVAKWLRNNVPTKKTKFLNHHVEYFTGAKAIDALLTSSWATGKTPLFTTRMEVADFLHEMLIHKFFHRAKKVPVSEQELKGRSKKKEPEQRSCKGGEESSREGKDEERSQASACEGKETKDSKDSKEKEKRKRKIRLDMHMEQVFLDTTDAYVWIYDPIPLAYWLAGLALVLGAIGVCMFPLWPPTVRKGVYYLSIMAAGFLVMIISLAVLRVVVFCLVWALTLSRHHLWLLPNLTEDVGFLASFWPLYQYEYKPPSTEQSGKKSKKKRKKEKVSDEEGEGEEKAAPAPAAAGELRRRNATDEPAKEAPDVASAERQSDSESESSQRSSTERDFEIVNAGDVDTGDVDTS